MEAIKVIRVCKESDCDNSPFTAPLKSGVKVFCCQKGFEQSLRDYASSLKPIGDLKGPEASNSDLAAEASHSCTEGNSIEQVIDVVRQEYYRLRELKDKYENTPNGLKYQYKCMAVRDVYNMLSNAQNPERSVATGDASSTTADPQSTPSVPEQEELWEEVYGLLLENPWKARPKLSIVKENFIIKRKNNGK